MQKQGIVRCRLDRFDGNDTAPRRSVNRFDGLGQGGRIPVVLVNDSETEAYGMIVEVLSY